MSHTVRIYKPAKTAMQSGRSNTRKWVLEFEPSDGLKTDTLMGWSGSHDTSRQLKLRFSSKEDAIAYAKRKGLTYRLMEPRERVVRAKTYADNFAFDRII
ncbi:MAG: ETC complex I subunit [Rhodospirillaceae bacterium]